MTYNNNWDLKRRVAIEYYGFIFTLTNAAPYWLSKSSENGWSRRRSML